MRTPGQRQAWSTRHVLWMLLALAGCSDKPPTAPTPIPTVAPQSGVVALTVAGPDSVAPGTEAKYRATAKLQDGQTQDVTATADWSSSKTQVLELQTGGVARGRERGAAIVSAKFNGFEHSLAVRVLESGTFVLSGQVASTDSTPLVATIAVESGVGSGLSTTSDAAGKYELYGVAGDVQLQVSANGYQSRSITVSVTRDTTSLAILAPVVPPVVPVPPADPKALTVTGPARFDGQGTAQYRAMLEYTDGRSQDVTHLVAWSISKEIGYAMNIGQDGLVRGGGPGRSTLRATLGRFAHERQISAGPGWIVYGSITDAATGALIDWVYWEVVSGTAYQGDWNDFGQYSLYGAQGLVRLRVWDHRYVTRIVEFTVTSDMVFNIALTRAPDVAPDRGPAVVRR